MSKSYKKDTILKLLSGMSSEKEIRKYLDRFSSDDYKFAVIKVGGAVIQNDLDNLVSSLAFLNEVGLRPIIVHGGGPKLSQELERKKISFSFKEGQRVTSKKVLDVAFKSLVVKTKRLFLLFQTKELMLLQLLVMSLHAPLMMKILDMSEKLKKPNLMI